MHAEIISIGTELTSGQKLDTNSQWLSLQLADLGIPVHYHTTVADDLAANVAVLRAAAERADVVLVTGGLGPTLDDLTRQALAELGGVELVLHAPSLEFIEAFFRSRGRAMPERNRIQAMFPQGSEPLPNPIGTAPGIWMELSRSPRRATASATIDPVDQPPSPVAEAVPHAEVAHRCLLAAMPGVPSEMYRMFLEQVRPRLPGGGLLIRRARVNCFGLGESHVEELLGDLTARGRDPEIGITAHEATITLRIIAHGPTEDECRLKIDAARAEIRRRLGHYVFGDEDDELEHAVVRLLNERGRTLATAESGTGGLMSHLLTQSPGYEACYLGGLVVPSAAARRALLAIDDSADPISRETAGAMAAHCREAFHADYAVAVTQYPRIEPSAVMTAAPVAWLALASGSGVAVQEVNLGGNPAILRSRTAKAGLNLVRLRLIAGLLLAMCLGACREAPLPPAGVGTPANASQGGSTGAPGGRVEAGARFRDRTNAAGVDFTYRNDQEAGHYAILESLGGGVAVLDYDCDGRLDLFAPGGGAFAPGREIRGRPGAMFRSVGNWQYHNTTAAAALEPAPYYSHGAIVGDYDNDGFADVLVTGYGGLVLFRNLGDGTFQDAAADAGLDDRLWSSSAAWTDFDNDGDLDLYVAHYVNWSFDNDPACGTREKREVCPPRQFDPLPDSFYVNRGDGTFQEAARDVGLRTDGKGLGVVAADMDLDGRQDIYVGNDTVPNFLYRNTGEGRYADESLLSGTSLSDEGTPDGSMGVDVGDFNGDGRPDIWVANYERETCALYANQGRWLFRHVSRVSGVTAVGGLYVGWGTLFLDMDLDGDEDILVANGHVIRHPVNAPLRQAPLLFQNQSGKRLVNVAPNAGDYMASPHMARGAAAGDLDGDGDLDLAVTHTNEPLTVLECEALPGQHCLALRLTGTRSNRDANGAVAWLQTAEDSPVQVRQIKGGGSYASTSDRRLHFGLGLAANVATIRVRWPNGLEQTLHDVAADQEVHLVEAGSPAADGSVAGSPAGTE